MKRPTRWWIAVSIVVLISLIGAGRWLYVSINESVKDMYACADTAQLIVHHLHVHQEWPRSWEELERTYHQMPERARVGRWSISDIRRRCDFSPYIDWNRLRDPRAFDELDRVKAIWPRHGDRFTSATAFGNNYLVGYLQRFDQPDGDPMQLSQ